MNRWDHFMCVLFFFLLLLLLLTKDREKTFSDKTIHDGKWILSIQNVEKILPTVVFFFQKRKHAAIINRWSRLDDRRPWWTYSASFHLCQYVVSIRQSLLRRFSVSNLLIDCSNVLSSWVKESVLFSYSLSSLFLITFYKCNSHLLCPPPFSLSLSPFFCWWIFFANIHMQT